MEGVGSVPQALLWEADSYISEALFPGMDLPLAGHIGLCVSRASTEEPVFLPQKSFSGEQDGLWTKSKLTHLF